MERRTQLNFFSTKPSNADIIYCITTDNYQELTTLVTEANVNAVIDTKNKFTALHYAIRSDNDKMITFLLNMGANPNLKTADKQDAFDLSLKYQNKTAFSYEIEEVRLSNGELQKTISTLQKKINTMDTNSRYLIKSVDELVLKNSNLKDDISLLRKDNGSLKTENSSLKAEVELTRKDNEVLTANIGSLKRKYDKLEDSYSGLLNKLRK
jgi:FtsZ-binding cell division protein ZapB